MDVGIRFFPVQFYKYILDLMRRGLMSTIELETTIDAPIKRVFDLTRHVNAHLETMDEHDESVIGGVTDGILTENDIVTWQARYFGIPLQLTVEVSKVQRPTFFRDELVEGPFSELVHDHHFEAVSAEQTQMRDEFHFTAPGGPIGALVDRLYLDTYMKTLLSNRNRRLKHITETDEWTKFLK